MMIWRPALLATTTVCVLAFSTPAAAKPQVSIIFQDQYSVVTLTEHGNQQAVEFVTTFPATTLPDGAEPQVQGALSDLTTLAVDPGQTVYLPRHVDVVGLNVSYPSLVIYGEVLYIGGCISPICVTGEYGPTDFGNRCDLTIDNTSSEAAVVTLSDGQLTEVVTVEPQSAVVLVFPLETACPLGVSVQTAPSE